MQGEVECLKDNKECQGSNVWILFFNSIAPNIFNSFIVERTRMLYGVSLQPSDNQRQCLDSAGIVVMAVLVYHISKKFTDLGIP